MTDLPWPRARARARLARTRIGAVLPSVDWTATPLRSLISRRLGMDAVLVVGAILVVLRLGNVFPW
ncbi:MAG TPA: hypothetical protein VFP19_04280, partial [Candidatus Limnocylindrales bacterium]|nr:hypothetical protein [Candidatus Limnocylindrales bacterium]